MRLIWIHILSHIDDFKINKFTIHVSSIGLVSVCLFAIRFLQCWGTQWETTFVILQCFATLLYLQCHRFTRVHFSLSLCSDSVDWRRVYLARDSLEVGRWKRLICVCVARAPMHTHSTHSHRPTRNDTAIDDASVLVCNEYYQLRETMRKTRFPSESQLIEFMSWNWTLMVDCLRIDCCIGQFSWFSFIRIYPAETKMIENKLEPQRKPIQI